MRFRNSIRLLMENFKNVYRLLLYKLILMLVACALCSAFILPEIQEILRSAEVQALVKEGKNFLKAFIALDEELLLTSRQALVGENGKIREALRYLTDMKSEIVWTCVACVCVFFVQHFISILCDFTIGSILNDKMTTYADTPFFTAYIANLGKASKYAIVYAPISLVVWLVSFAFCYVCLTFLSTLLALFISFTAIVILQALKLTVIGHWMPAETIGKKMVEIAPIGELEKRQKSKEFSSYMVSIYCIIVINVIAGLCTCGSALLISVPASYMFLICMQYVNYYTAKGKKYFVTYEKIENNAHFGDSEHIFEYIEQQEKTENNETNLEV